MFRPVTLAIGILTAASLAACSTVPSREAARTASAIPHAACSAASGAVLAPGSRGCTAVTRTYSGRQLRETGATNVALALQMLDPSITAVGGH